MITPFSRRLKYFLGSCLLLILTNIFVMAHEGVKTYYHHVYISKNTDYRIVKALRGYGGKVVADTGNLGAVSFLLDPLDKSLIEPIDIQTISSCNELKDTILVTNSTYGWWSNNDSILNLERRLPCLKSPPDDWQEIRTTGPERIFKISKN